MSEFSKFDTQIHVEETNEYQPTAADLAELNEWLDEVEADLPELDEYDMQVDLAELEAQEGELELDVDGDEWDEYDGQPSEYDEWQDYYGGDDWDHGQYDSEGEW